jgi:hypothetical protein
MCERFLVTFARTEGPTPCHATTPNTDQPTSQPNPYLPGSECLGAVHPESFMSKGLEHMFDDPAIALS